MAVDTFAPLCTAADLESGAFADLVRAYDPAALNDVLLEATRACESEAGRRFVPFTVTESHRAEGIDPNELGELISGIPLDFAAAQGVSYAAALGTGIQLVRRIWLNETAPRYPEMWAYSNVSVSVTVSIGGTNPAQLLRPVAPDTGLVWLRLGSFVPQGSILDVTYSGGYQTYPADLRRAGKYMAASIIARELAPFGNVSHNADELESLAVMRLAAYAR